MTDSWYLGAKLSKVISNEEFIALVKKCLELTSSAELSRKFGVSRPAIQRWVDGRNMPAPGMMDSVMKALNQIIITHSSLKEMTAIAEEQDSNEKV